MNKNEEKNGAVRIIGDDGTVMAEGETIEECMKALSYPENDPRNPAYKRVLVRPPFSVKRLVANIFVPLAVAGLLGVALYFTVCLLLNTYGMGAERNEALVWGITAGVPSGLIFLYVFMRLKSIAIWAIKTYQHFASDETRKACRFEPSCSEYAIMAIEKYGFWKGGVKSVKRLLRCRPPYGGYDPLD